MVSLQECFDLSGLDEDTIRVIAERERLPDIVAAELGYTLMRTPGGVKKLRGIIRDDLKQAAVRGDLVKSLRLNRALARLNAREQEVQAA
jgi:hypothetical protein